VGTGIGGGLVLNGALYRGNRFTAGEIGHAVIDPDGKPQRRTVEDLCSRTGIRRTLGENLDTAAIARGYRDGDARIRDVIDDSARLLGIAIANWVTVLSLDTVILGGGITEALGEPYADRIRESFRRDVFPDALRDCEILITHLEADAAIYGAALLAREAITAPDR
jgi:glucokinase